ncbi:GNAT family N-acetyltransferase [Candidatus Woesearchaeota archaeon]|nr:GNAT family N-acetyltransferase [Candidatus Woesearchaeota archaeon]
MRIRRAKKQDIPQLIKLSEAFAKADRKTVGRRMQVYAERVTNVRKIHESEFLKAMRKKNEFFGVAEVDNEIVGYIEGSIERSDRLSKIPRMGCMEEIYIDRKHRGKGIASELRELLFNWFRKRGIRHIQIDVFCRNKKPMQIYKKWGFKPYFVNMRLRLE